MKEPGSMNRRNALKTLAALTGAAVASLPKSWSTPELRLGALPAHAQTSGITNMTVRVDWTSVSPTNIDLSVVQPDANYVGWDPVGVLFVGTTGVLTHSGESGYQTLGSETITTTGTLLPGTYNIVVSIHYELLDTLTATITLDGVPTVINLLPAFSGTGNFRWVAAVSIPSGVISTADLGNLYP